MKFLKYSLLGLLAAGLLALHSDAQVSGHMDWQKLPGRCAACHTGHGMPGTAMLPLAEEDFCFQCHGDFSELQLAVRERRVMPNVRVKNMRNVFRKAYRHPVELKTSRLHRDTLETKGVFSFSQAECLDCHRGHGVTKVNTPAGSASRRSTKNERQLEFQLCYQCHARIIPSTMGNQDIRSWFETVNPSYHPVEAPGKNGDVPSLKEPYTAASVINCTDCHNNDDPDGPRGPHGSNFEFILEKNYNTRDSLPESPRQYDLCYKCHDRQSILQNESFPYHSRHIVDGATSCFTCHHSHGSRRNTHLIRFSEEVDPFVVRPSSSGRLEFIDNGRYSGECFLSCHGVDHNPKRYRNRRQ